MQINIFRSWPVLLLASVLLVGCAHPINISPSISNVAVKTTQNSAQRSPISVGYYISQKNRELEVTTPGGGGDNVRYHPYEAIELGYRDILLSLYRNVAAANAESPGPNDRFDYVIEPTIITNSGSTGFFTWPPTNFSVDITNTIRDATGRVIADPRVVGIGMAETSERLVDHGFAGRRAMEEALMKTHSALQQINLEKNGNKREPSPVVHLNTSPVEKVVDQPKVSSVEERLRRLRDLKDKGLITNKDYEVQKKLILDSI